MPSSAAWLNDEWSKCSERGYQRFVFCQKKAHGARPSLQAGLNSGARSTGAASARTDDIPYH